MSLDVGPAIRAALIGNAPIAALLPNWRGGPAVFAYRPVPADAPDRLIIINPDISITDQDGLTSDRPIVARDIAIYGNVGPAGDPADDTPIVEALGYMIRALFHRQRFSVQIDGYSVIQALASGPTVAPVDDDKEVGRMVGLTISLRRNP